MKSVFPNALWSVLPEVTTNSLSQLNDVYCWQCFCQRVRLMSGNKTKICLVNTAKKTGYVLMCLHQLFLSEAFKFRCLNFGCSYMVKFIQTLKKLKMIELKLRVEKCLSGVWLLVHTSTSIGTLV